MISRQHPFEEAEAGVLVLQDWIPLVMGWSLESLRHPVALVHLSLVSLRHPVETPSVKGSHSHLSSQISLTS
jgi:hypothetical protein